jgi:hypothetical protein
LPKDNYRKTKIFISDKGGDDGIPGELAQNLEFLNVLVAEIDELQKVDCFTLAHRLTNRRLRRSPDISADKVYAHALLALDRLAFDASQNDTKDLEFAGHLTELEEMYLSNSGLVDIDNGSFVFASSAVQSYFAVDGLRDQMPSLLKTQASDWPPVYSQTTIKDIRKFLSPKCAPAPLTKEIAQVKMALTCSLNRHVKDYDKTTMKLLMETIGKKSPTDTCEFKP